MNRLLGILALLAIGLLVVGCGPSAPTTQVDNTPETISKPYPVKETIKTPEPVKETTPVVAPEPTGDEVVDVGAEVDALTVDLDSELDFSELESLDGDLAALEDLEI